MTIFISILILGLAAYLVHLSRSDVKRMQEQVNALLSDRDFLNNHIGALEQILADNNKLVSDKTQENQLLTDYLEMEKKRNNDVLSQKKSSEVRTGLVAETFAAFYMEGFDPKRMRFLGSPIDLICFGSDEITFIEVKTNKAVLSQSQKSIKQLVLDKKVSWKEVRFSGK